MKTPAGSAIGPFGMATILGSLVMLGAGILQPQAAEVLLRLLIAGLALGFILARAYRAMLPARMPGDFYSPFDGPRAERAPPALPEGIRKLADDLAAADDPRTAARSAIPRAVRWRVIDEAARRLTDHYGLDLRVAGDHEAIRSLVSGATWQLLRGEAGPGPDPDAAPPPAAGSSVARLPLVLDDLERL